MKTQGTYTSISTSTISRNGNGIFCSNFGRNTVSSGLGFREVK